MKTEVRATPRRQPAYTRRMSYLIIFFIVVLVLPLHMHRSFVVLREVANSPFSRVLLFGEPADPLEMAARLNPDGVPIYMNDVLSRTLGGGCSSGGADPAFPKGRQTVVTFLVDDVQRQAVVYVPNSYPSDNAAPTPVAMLVLYHGLNDNCEHFLNATGLLPYAEKYGFVVVSACGSQGYLGTAWNSGMCCGFSDDKPNDVGFAQSIAREMGEALCIDPRKVMAVGFSNGAMLAEVLACEAPDVYRAAVSIGGVVELRPGNEEGLARCTEKVQTKYNRTSVLMVHGSSDVMVPWGGNKLLGFPSVPANVAAWVGRNDCVPSSTNTTISTKTYTNTIYTECNRHAMMNLWVADVAQFTDDTFNDEDESTSQCDEVDCDLELDSEQVADVQLEQQQHEILGLDVEDLSAMKKTHQKVHEHQNQHKPPHDVDDNEPENDDEEVDDDNDGDDKKHWKKGPAAKHHEKGHDGEEEGEEEEGEEQHRHKTSKGGKNEKHDDPNGDHDGKHGKGHPHAPPPPPPPHAPHKPEEPETERIFIDPATIAADSGVSQIELVKVEGGGHRWPEDDEFSTTDYIIAFGARVMNGYK